MPDQSVTLELLQPGQKLARGVCRMLRSLDFACLDEFTPDRGMRVDVMGMGSKGELWIVECKSSRADFMSDTKWTGYLNYCDRYFWAVDAAFPVELLPEGTGLIFADSYDAEIRRMPEPAALAAARRKVLTRKFARAAALRLHTFRDPDAALSG
ncbi:MAG: MmcB family DNA repair protein [Dinoroseobacter sp.]|nr:MmcB family DNA repair protein [Dinoroseobacter sp.]